VSPIQATWRLCRLRTRYPFAIARGSRQEWDRVHVRLEWEGLTGLGEAAPSAYYGETVETAQGALEVFAPLLGDDPHARQAIRRRWTAALGRGHGAARAALDMALYDLAGQALGAPLYRFFGLDPAAAPVTSVTIGMGSEAEIREKVRAATGAGFGILKVKLGGPADLETLRAVREEAPAARIRVDANAAWDAGTAARMAGLLADSGVELLEQPVAAGDLEGLAKVNRLAALPIFVDEGCVAAEDVPRIAGKCQGVVVKLGKTGGPGPAFQQIVTARAHDLKVMIGCFIESSLGITAAAHLAPAADLLDTDGALLLESDPFAGAVFTGLETRLPDRPGLGVTPRP